MSFPSRPASSGAARCVSCLDGFSTLPGEILAWGPSASVGLSSFKATPLSPRAMRVAVCARRGCQGSGLDVNDDTVKGSTTKTRDPRRNLRWVLLWAAAFLRVFDSSWFISMCGLGEVRGDERVLGGAGTETAGQRAQSASMPRNSANRRRRA